MSENNKFKSINNALDINLSLNSLDDISTKRFISSNNINNSNNEQPGIIEVYEDNFREEIKN